MSITFSQTFFSLLLVVATAVVQLAAQLSLDRIVGLLPRASGGFAGLYRVARTITAVVVLMFGHLVQVTIWAARYYEWGELHGFLNSFYFSLASFTTVGASELTLSGAHRLTGAVEAAVGMLMVGWSTALVFYIIHRADRKDQD
jgi:hypothetical protein